MIYVSTVAYNEYNAIFLAVSDFLAAATPFLSAVANLYPTLSHFRRDFYAEDIRSVPNQYHIVFPDDEPLDSPTYERLARSPVKLLYIRGSVTEDLVNQLSSWEYKPVLVCEQGELKKVQNLAVASLPTSSLSTVALQRALRLAVLRFERPFCEISEDALQLKSVASVRDAIKSYSFEGSGLRATTVDDMYEMRPTQRLPNFGRRTSQDTITERFVAEPGIRQIENCRRFWAQRRVSDSLGLRASQKRSFGPQADALLDDFLNSGTSSAFDALCDHAIQTPLPVPLPVIVFVPAFSYERLCHTLPTKFPDRVKRLICEGVGSRRTNQLRSNLKPAETTAARELALLMRSAKVTMMSLITLRGFEEQIPVICAPTPSGDIFAVLTKLLRSHRSGVVKEASDRFATVGEQLRSCIPPEILEYISEEIGDLRVISDLPLEWTSVEGVPLCVRVKVSKMPASAPLLLRSQRAGKNTLHLTQTLAERVLILNCLHAEDRLSRFPLRLSQVLTERGAKHVYREVQSHAEYKAALAAHKPFVLVHCGHGYFDSLAFQGFLDFGRERVNPWATSEPEAVPPIVLLASCETLSFTAPYTPAASFLGRGARAVLGTMLQVEADRTMAVLDDILALMNEAATAKRRMRTWGDVLHHSIRRSEMRDICFDFNIHIERSVRRGLPSAVFSSYMQRVDTEYKGKSYVEVYKRRAERRDFLRLAVRDKEPALAATLEAFLATWVEIPHSLFFTSLGDPESIVFAPENSFS